MSSARPATRSLRDKILNGAIAAGKLTEDRRGAYERMWAADPTETAAVIAQLLKPKTAGKRTAAVRTTPTVPAPTRDYDTGWLTAAERARIDGAYAGAPFPRIAGEGMDGGPPAAEQSRGRR